MTQKERQERSRKEIFQAALEEFGTRGYDNVTMDSICGRHGISKGMMYHYYSNKDELFLLCVQDTFQALKAQIERDAAELSGQSSFDSIKNYLLIREYFFQLHPKRKLIFENAMLRPPKQLAGQIRALHAPLKEDEPAVHGPCGVPYVFARGAGPGKGDPLSGKYGIPLLVAGFPSISRKSRAELSTPCWRRPRSCWI